jgi:hypothetical protein
MDPLSTSPMLQMKNGPKKNEMSTSYIYMVRMVLNMQLIPEPTLWKLLFAYFLLQTNNS